MSRPCEEPFFFQTPTGRRLFGVFHSARGQVDGRVAIVYCHPLFEEKLNSHRVMVGFARNAALAGFDVLRFDYYGDGESDGGFCETSVTTRIEDISAAVAEVRGRVRDDADVYLLGLRVGALFSFLCAAREPRIAGVIGWAPVLDLHAFLLEQLRSNITAQMVAHKRVLHTREELIAQLLSGSTVDVDGYEMGPDLFREASKLSFSFDETTVRDRLVIAFRAHASNEVTATRVGADMRVVEEVEFWRPQRRVYPACTRLFSETLDWLAMRRRGSESTVPRGVLSSPPAREQSDAQR